MDRERVIELLKDRNLYNSIEMVYAYLDEKGIEINRAQQFVETICNDIRFQLEGSLTKVIDYCTRYYMRKFNICFITKDNKVILYY